MALFKDFNISADLLKAIEKMGFEEMTPIQEKGIPIIMEKHDIIGQAQTGTGKTACFGIPLIESIDAACETVEAVILTPTRELAVQVAEELNRIGQFKKINCLPIYGGQDINLQIRALKKRPQIIVATPGRLMDHMNRHTIKFDNVKTAVLDEADEMLDMGFVEDIENILEKMPPERQTLLFSATMPRKIQELAGKFMHDPEKVLTKPKELTVPDIEQTYIEMKEKEKFDVLCRLLDTQAPPLAIVFGRTKRRVDELSEGLEKRGYLAEGIHGDLTQARRETVLHRFKTGLVEILVATDVAARGLDISGVTHVYNFDIPQDAESYVHRIGRTGRAGNSGLAITFVTPREIDQLNVIRNLVKTNIIRKPVPTMDEAFAGQQAITRTNLLQVVEEGSYHIYKALAEELLSANDSVTLLSAALKMLTKEPDLTPVRLTDEAPVIAKRRQDSRFSGSKRGGYKGRDNSKDYSKDRYGKKPERSSSRGGYGNSGYDRASDSSGERKDRYDRGDRKDYKGSGGSAYKGNSGSAYKGNSASAYKGDYRRDKASGDKKYNDNYAPKSGGKTRDDKKPYDDRKNRKHSGAFLEIE